ncbi:hypothetical protein [Burkholderia stagnalis]|uniref:hypothetical protein n=1 Tax=Burkholderia stagnalis TaxID=1503054 RepID=UPI0012DA9D68|nr:hypothetical protein [Burkholderia stagnalis]
MKQGAFLSLGLIIILNVIALFHGRIRISIRPWPAPLKQGNLAGPRRLRPGRDTASGPHANKIGRFQGGVIEKVHLSVLSGAQCDARENPRAEIVRRRT